MNRVGAPLFRGDDLRGLPQHARPWLFREYCSTLLPEDRAAMRKMAESTYFLFNKDRQFAGNGFAITSLHVVTAGHCVAGDGAFVGDTWCKVVFRGADHGLDFTILRSPRNTASFFPASLSISPPSGTAVLSYIRMDQQRPSLFVQPTELEEGVFATRSFRVLTQTSPGQSGAPVMSLVSGRVFAIHQGEKEGIKIGDLLDVLEANPNEETRAILQDIDLNDGHLRSIDRSTVVLKPGDVAEEKPRVQGKLPSRGGIMHHYAEMGEGRGNRAVRIWQVGTQSSDTIYAIEPNPHENKKYNNGGQGSFYAAIANELVEKNLPEGLAIKVLGETYNLTRERT